MKILCTILKGFGLLKNYISMYIQQSIPFPPFFPFLSKHARSLTQRVYSLSRKVAYNLIIKYSDPRNPQHGLLLQVAGPEVAGSGSGSTNPSTLNNNHLYD